MTLDVSEIILYSYLSDKTVLIRSSNFSESCFPLMVLYMIIHASAQTYSEAVAGQTQHTSPVTHYREWNTEGHNRY